MLDKYRIPSIFNNNKETTTHLQELRKYRKHLKIHKVRHTKQNSYKTK